MHPFEAWFAARGWHVWPFQRQAWQAYGDGQSGLVRAPTGAGKSYAAYGGALMALHDGRLAPGRGLRIVYVTPLRALARDIELALAAPINDLKIAARVESRTGDTAAKVRARQRRELPEVLVITPESLALLITRADARNTLANIACAIVDEWHELQASKRGVQLQLTLSRLRALSPQLQTWGLSATLHDAAASAEALLPRGAPATIIEADAARPIELTTLLPDVVDPLPWAGHLGLAMLPKVLGHLDPTCSSLLFTNTRSQAERWFQAIKAARPDWAGILALHHGSLDRQVRADVEEGLKSGRVKIAVVTSSLDLGVDFPTVERVYQIGSPKGVARLLQRAGRSAHRPLATCRATCVPSNSFELLEFAAARRGVSKGLVEERRPALGGLDVLAQHLVSCALGGGFAAAEMLEEVRATAAYGHLDDEAFAWCLRFVVSGGQVLDAYPAFQRVVRQGDVYSVTDRRQAQLHRLNIGTIVADEQADIKLVRGKRLGRVEESYIAKLRTGDRFVFAGRTLELIKQQELTAIVKPASGSSANVPAWQGTLLPWSLPLGGELRSLIADLGQPSPPPALLAQAEVRAATPLLAVQQQLSHLPRTDELLLETWRDAAGSYLFGYPFAGRGTHEAIAALLAWRLARRWRTTFAIAANDYGWALISTKPLDFAASLATDDFSCERLKDDMHATIATAQTAKRRFREIARIAGIVHQSYPGKRKGGRAVHASAALLFDTLSRFDPGNLLVAQAHDEAFRDLCGGEQLAKTLRACQQATWVWRALAQPSPLAFPLIVERVRARLGSESLEERVLAMKESWLQEAGKAPKRPKRQTLRSAAAMVGLAKEAGL